MEYLVGFVEAHKADIPEREDPANLPLALIHMANEIDDTLISLSELTTPGLDQFFAQLHNQEYQAVSLSKRKGRRYFLRIYALKIDEDCFVITGGAIKFTHLMEDREHTKRELVKLNKCRDYLRSEDVFDADSFYEFLSEQG